MSTTDCAEKLTSVTDPILHRYLLSTWAVDRLTWTETNRSRAARPASATHFRQRARYGQKVVCLTTLTLFQGLRQQLGGFERSIVDGEVPSFLHRFPFLFLLKRTCSTLCHTVTFHWVTLQGSFSDYGSDPTPTSPEGETHAKNYIHLLTARFLHFQGVGGFASVLLVDDGFKDSGSSLVAIHKMSVPAAIGLEPAVGHQLHLHPTD
jgi:hypothetical protein